MFVDFRRRAVAAVVSSLVLGSVAFAAPALAEPPDTDGDGTADEFEILIGTDPQDPASYAIDADADGYPDFYEVQEQTDPDDPNDHPGVEPAGEQRPDTDGDGLFDDDEVDVYGTDPAAPDTDGDGGTDGAEVYGETDPLVADDQERADTDGDGLYDIDEVKLYATDPEVADTDGDGVDDGAEDDNGTDPVDAADF